VVKHPLALLPVVTIAGGRARLAPAGSGASTGDGTPAEAIASWVDQGAAWIHVVDQDAADGEPAVNPEHLAASGAHLQYRGGVRDENSLASALAMDVAHVVIEADDLDWACAAVAEHGGRVAVGVDLAQPDTAEAQVLERAGCRRFVVRDVAGDRQRRALAEFCGATRVPVMVSGGVAHLGDLHQLHELVPQGLDGILLDDALYRGAFTYAEAVAAGADSFDMWHWVTPFIG
jgi:phosphoribosylformimino-5-aminoimidazole carboxamide ribonucleotide (ProFAR) isomerase